MAWAADQRQAYIAIRLGTHGWIQRKHLADHFQVSIAQASIDLNRFIRERPGIMTYDKTAKRYVTAPGVTGIVEH